MNTQIPNTLRLHRKRAGFRQSDVAWILGLGKRGADRIMRWEKGYAFPKLENLLKLSLLYRVQPEELYAELFKTLHKDLAKKLKRKKGNK